MKRFLLSLLAFLLAVGCQIAPPSLPPSPSSPPAPPQPVLTWVDTLPQQAATLPAAQVTAVGGRLTIAYPQESLFASGSVLPLAGGAEALDPLVTLLKAYPQSRWGAKVAAATANGADYDLALARKRSELLQRYLFKGGVAKEQVTWQEKSGAASPLELTLLPQVPAGSSSGGKE